MEALVYNYIAKKLLEDIKKEQSLEPELIKSITNREFMNSFRSIILEEDLKYFAHLINSDRYEIRKFAFTAIQELKNAHGVKKIVFDFWKHSSSYEEKWLVMFSLLDYEDLDISIHENIFDFISHNLDRWLIDTCKYMANGEENEILSAVKKRLDDKKYPATKNWIYLLIAFSSPKKNTVLDLIEKYQDARFPMNKNVKVLFKKLYSEEDK